MNQIVLLLSFSMLLLCACKDSKGANKQVETDKPTDTIVQAPKEVPFEVKPFLVENKQLNDTEKFLIEKGIEENTVNLEYDGAVKLQKTISQSFFNTLDLSKIKPTVQSNQNCFITATVNFSTAYYSFIIGFEDRNSWYESYLVNYDKKGLMIDFLLMTQGDYIESFTFLESKITKDAISRTMYRANYDKAPSESEVWKEDQFIMDDHGAFQGEDLIFSVEKENTHIAADSFIGNWKKSDVSSPIDPTYFQIKKEAEHGYTIKFSNEDYFVPAAYSSGVLKGKNNSGDFELEMAAETLTVMYYSDDGRGGHFNPTKKEKFVKEELPENLLIGKWQSTNDDNNFLEFTNKLKIETNIGVEYIEAYTVANTCLNGEGIASKADDYISGHKSELCWYIISVDEENLSLSFVGRGNALNFKRVKH